MVGALLIWVLAAQPDAGSPLRDIQASHIDANVPDSANFDTFLRRDLAAHFAGIRNRKTVAVDYELLRNGPTQSGVAYPKFYVWVRVNGGRSAQDRGAARLAAMEKKRFEVTDFVSEEAIRTSPDQIYAVFPAAVCERIKAKVKE